MWVCILCLIISDLVESGTGTLRRYDSNSRRTTPDQCGEGYRIQVQRTSLVTTRVFQSLGMHCQRRFNHHSGNMGRHARTPPAPGSLLDFPSGKVGLSASLFRSSVWAEVICHCLRFSLKCLRTLSRHRKRSVEREFQKRFGLTNREQYYFRRMTQYKQYTGQDCKNYTDEFERLRDLANVMKGNAFFYLKMGTMEPLRPLQP